MPWTNAEYPENFMDVSPNAICSCCGEISDEHRICQRDRDRVGNVRQTYSQCRSDPPDPPRTRLTPAEALGRTAGVIIGSGVRLATAEQSGSADPLEDR